jgi:putative peptidoglycan lipid II flippase
MYPFFPLVALAAAFMGILNACGKFFLPALASAIFNFTSIVSGVCLTFVFMHFGYPPIMGMAVGVVLGGAAQAFCQLPALYKLNYRWVPSDGARPWYREPGLKQMLLLMIPGTIGMGATQINVLINTLLASTQGTGAISYLNYAFRLMQFPIGIFGVSLAAAALPRLSSLWVDKNVAGYKNALSESLRHVFAINLLAASGLAFLGLPIIQLIFEYGAFSFADSQATAAVLAAYAVGLVGYSMVKILVPACYALGNTRLPVVSSVLSVALTIALNLAMIESFGYIGLALGTSFAAIFNAGFLFIAVRRVLHKNGDRLEVRPLLKSFLGYLFCALVAGLSVYFMNEFFFAPSLTKVLDLFDGTLALVALRLTHLFILGVIFIGIALVFGYVTRQTEILSIVRYLQKRLLK